MITKEQIIDIARDELTPIGWHEEQAKYIDGLDAFAEKLVKLCNISHVRNQLCDCKDFKIKGNYKQYSRLRNRNFGRYGQN